MMRTLNKVCLIGWVNAKPEIKTLKNDKKIAIFYLDTLEMWHSRELGHLQNKIDRYKISVFREDLIKITENYVKQGNKLYVEGNLSIRKVVTSDNFTKIDVEVILRGYRGILIPMDDYAKKDEIVPENDPMEIYMPFEDTSEQQKNLSGMN